MVLPPHSIASRTTAEERAEMRRLHAEGMPIIEISKRLQRHRNLTGSVLKTTETQIRGSRFTTKENICSASCTSLSDTPATSFEKDGVFTPTRYQKHVLGDILPNASMSRSAVIGDSDSRGNYAVDEKTSVIDVSSYIPSYLREFPNKSKLVPRISPDVSFFIKGLKLELGTLPFMPVFREIGITSGRHLDALAREIKDEEGSKVFCYDLSQEFEKRGIRLVPFFSILRGLRSRVVDPPECRPLLSSQHDAVSGFLAGLNLSLLHHLDILREVYLFNVQYLDYAAEFVKHPGSGYLIWFLKTHESLQSITPLEWLFLIHGLNTRAV